jgi:hypothetical protein
MYGREPLGKGIEQLSRDSAAAGDAEFDVLLVRPVKIAAAGF